MIRVRNKNIDKFYKFAIDIVYSYIANSLTKILELYFCLINLQHNVQLFRTVFSHEEVQTAMFNGEYFCTLNNTVHST